MKEQRHKILVVDDSDTVRAHVKDLLGAHFDCVYAVNGLDGFQKAVSEQPHAVISDLEMPLMDGTELLKKIRGDKRTSHIPVIIVTTVTDIAKVNECRGLGCAGFVLKPLQQEYVLAKLRQVISANARARIA
jgi:CheY-like chemotaxis protein